MNPERLALWRYQGMTSKRTNRSIQADLCLAVVPGVDRRGLLRRTSKLAYGTTLTANALVEAKVARTGFIRTRGFAIRSSSPASGA